MPRVLALLLFFVLATPTLVAQPQPQPATPADVLRGSYGPYRANNDLLHYTLAVRVDPVAKSIRGTNTIRFRMLQPGSRIQLELTSVLNIDDVRQGQTALKVTREGTTFFVDFPKPLKKGKVYEITVAYSGQPKEIGRFGGMVFKTDPQGGPWVVTSCEDEGASVWWPNKDQWKDEPQEGIDIYAAVPNGLTDVSNGRLLGSRDLHDGYTEWHWRVTYPINNYDVALNIANYAHFSDSLDGQYGKLDLDYYVLPQNLDKAKVQFAQVKPMLDIYQKYFGAYPFARDGYKLVEVPYAGMEHQSAVAYGNHYQNSYFGPRDWTGIGISPRFDFIIIHESGHEWFGNSVTAADRADMWIHEGFTTYMEDVYVEAMYGQPDAVRYVNSLKPKVRYDEPILQPRGENRSPSQDQYFKGALFLNTLRSVVNDDAKWFSTLHDLATHFAYKTILTEDVEQFMNAHLGADYTPIFDAYLRYTAIPALELRYNAAAGTVDYRWLCDVPGFNMPARVGDPAHWTTVLPKVGVWQTVSGKRATFAVDTTDYFIRTVQDPGTAAGVEPETAGWKLVWRDEFNALDGTAIDTAKWNVAETGHVYNKELEVYTARHNNVEQRGGNLEITARAEDYTSADGVAGKYTSARVTTQDKFSQKYGRIEARIKLPDGGQGVWPAFWMLGDPLPESKAWPDIGEIDIMEQIGREPGSVHGTLHGPGYGATSQLSHTFALPAGKAFWDDWHVFAVEWEPAAIRFYVDGALYGTETPANLPAGTKWVFDHPFYLIFNVAVGGDWPGKPDSSTKLPTTMQVDWVRVYDRVP